MARIHENRICVLSFLPGCIRCAGFRGGCAGSSDPARYVDPLIGNSNGGNTTPSARACTFGMISPGPATSFKSYGSYATRDRL